MNKFNSLVLSGCSTKGITALGALQYIYDENYHRSITNFIGTSSGSIISYLLSIGYTPLEIIVYLCTENVGEEFGFDIVSFMNGEGATKFKEVEKHLEILTILKLGKRVTLSEIKELTNNNFTCIALEHNPVSKSDKKIVLNSINYPSLDAIYAVRMSSTIPFIFDHFIHDGCYYFDGGIVDNFPLDELKETDTAFCINVIVDETPSVNVPLEYFYHLASLPVKELCKYKCKNKKNCLIFHLKTINLKAFNFNLENNLKLDLFSLGYNSCKNFFKKLN
jgi:NTE family protein